MINCPKCNTQVPEGTKFCPSCGTQMPEASAPVTHQGYVSGENPCSQYNQPQYQPSNGQSQYGYQYTVQQPEDRTNVGLCILSVFVPLFGIIYYFCTRQKKPKEAKGCLKASLISAGVSIVLSIIITMVTIGSIFHLANKAIDNGVGSYSITFGDDAEDFTTDGDFKIKMPVVDGEPEVSSSEVDSNWKNYTVSVAGNNITLPISYSDFTKKTGYAFVSDDDANSTLKGNYYNIVTLKNGDKKLHATIVNENKDMKTLKECTIKGISAYNNQNSEDVIFAGNLKAGMEYSKESLISVFGTPSKEYDKEGYYTATYYEDYDRYYSQRSFSVTICKGIITDIQIDRRGE